MTIPRAPFLAMLTLATACGSALRARDAGPDARAPDAGHAEPTLVTGMTADASDPVLPASPRPADLSCLGTRTLPALGSDVATMTTLLDIRTGEPASGLCVHVYRGEVPVDDTCLDADPRTDAQGVLSLSAPSTGAFALRVFPHVGVAALDSYPETTVYGTQIGTLPLLAPVSRALLNEAGRVTSVDVDPSAAIVGVLLMDCRNRPVYGARVRLARSDGTPIDLEGGNTRVVYADGAGLWSATQPWTHVAGRAVVVNVPVVTPGETIWVEMFGRVHLADELTLIACETVQITPGTLSALVPIQPLRADGPSCPLLP